MVAVLIAIVLVEGLLFVKDAALLGALLLHELVVHSALLPRHLLLLLPFQTEDQALRLLLGMRGWGRSREVF